MFVCFLQFYRPTNESHSNPIVSTNWNFHQKSWKNEKNKKFLKNSIDKNQVLTLKYVAYIYRLLQMQTSTSVMFKQRKGILKFSFIYKLDFILTAKDCYLG